ncbi:polysaccharide deacetylase family protein [Halobacteriales archaeon Cl-PHB]
MSKQTRRAFLATSAVAGLAGCINSLGSSNDSTPTDNGTGVGSTPDDTTPTATDTPSGPLADLPGRQVDGFESLENWYSLNGVATLSASSKDPYAGSQSARVASTNGDPYAGLFKAFSEPKDFTGKNVSLAAKFNKPDIAKLQVDLLAPDRGNKVRLSRTLTGPSDTWLRFDMGVAAVDRDPDLSKVREVRVIARRRNGVEEPVDVEVDDLRVVDAPKKGAVMFTFDDSHITHYENAFPVLDQYGMPGVEGVIAETVYQSGRLDVGMMREMSDAGWDMASHPVTQGKWLSEFTKAEQERRIRNSKQFLVKKGFEEGARHFLTPQNFRGPDTYDLVTKHHDTMYSFGGTPNAMPMTSRYNYGRVNAGNLDVVTDLVDYAERFNQLLVINHHVIGEDGLPLEQFKSEVEYVDGADVDVVSASDMLDRQTESGN